MRLRIVFVVSRVGVCCVACVSIVTFVHCVACDSRAGCLACTESCYFCYSCWFIVVLLETALICLLLLFSGWGRNKLC